jgi:alkanesulfonate monooxygenase SsuD/methylene tetrahydromethanopterin reductase-like flavin-dependent oxidoreductase (luciferase family)
LPALEQGAKESRRGPRRIKKILEIACSYADEYEKAQGGVARVVATLVPGFLDTFFKPMSWNEVTYVHMTPRNVTQRRTKAAPPQLRSIRFPLRFHS